MYEIFNKFKKLNKTLLSKDQDKKIKQQLGDLGVSSRQADCVKSKRKKFPKPSSSDMIEKNIREGAWILLAARTGSKR
ncbi:MAG: hypothetical protein FWD13_12885, partial [Treponema sp.]|nr:hypothetical protein [Treponema sp.]